MAHILVVDDEPEVIALLTDFLRAAGYEVDSALHGGDALMLLETGHFDVVLLDHLMPGITGWDVLRRVRMLHPGLQVIVITGHGSRQLGEQMLRRGAFDYIRKPFDLSYVGRAVAAAVDRRPWGAGRAMGA